MTTKPRARKFRIRRRETAAEPDADPTRNASEVDPLAQRAQDSLRSREDDPEAIRARADQVRATRDQTASAATGATTIDEIRQEGLTGRQLRLARRIAQKHGLAPTSDFDAVRLLRLKGIDPLQRSNMLELVAPKANTGEAADKPVSQLPQAAAASDMKLPSTGLSPSERRLNEIAEIQRDISRRRRRRLALLVARLSFFVFLPTILAGYYFASVATPMYATNSQFLVIQNEGGGGRSGLGGLMPSQFATSQDAIAVQGYLQSKEVMLRLDDDLGFKAHFQQEEIDAIQRLEDNATIEAAHKVYRKRVKIGFDPTEGVVHMEVIAADPEVSAQFSERLIAYAEERVNQLSSEKRDDQMRDARRAFDEAVSERRAAQEELVSLQLQGETLDPESVIASLRGQINTIETQVLEKELQLQAFLDNARPNQARVDGVRADIDRLKAQLVKLNDRMTDASQGENSLAQLSVRLQLAQADLATRDMMLQSALQQMEQTRTEAARQVRYLTVAVRPVAPQEATYPRVFENTVLAFLIFAGIYLMISLTASILREQVTS